MKTKGIIAFGCLITLSTMLYADDQLFWTTNQIANKIVQSLKESKKYRDYCGVPCNDTTVFTESNVKTVSIKKQDDGRYAVLLNNIEAQFSRIYVLHNGKWINVGILDGFKFEGYIPPEELPNSAEEWSD